jgi:hypothetical protein
MTEVCLSERFRAGDGRFGGSGGDGAPAGRASCDRGRLCGTSEPGAAGRCDRLWAEAEAVAVTRTAAAQSPAALTGRCGCGISKRARPRASYRATGKQIASGIQRLQNMRIRSRSLGFLFEISSLSISADGRCAVSGGRAETVRVWDPESGKAVNTLTDHRGWVEAVGVSAAPRGLR